MGKELVPRPPVLYAKFVNVEDIPTDVPSDTKGDEMSKQAGGGGNAIDGWINTGFKGLGFVFMGALLLAFIGWLFGFNPGPAMVNGPSSGQQFRYGDSGGFSGQGQSGRYSRCAPCKKGYFHSPRPGYPCGCGR